MTTHTNQDEVINRDAVIHTPYKGAYKAALDEPDEATPPAPVDGQDQEPESQEEKTYKKRYGDARTYINRLQDENRKTRAEMQAKIDALSRKKVELPKTEAEISAFANEFPDVFKTLVSIARKETIKSQNDLESRFDNVRELEAKLARDSATVRLSQLHPDWEELRETAEFHAWAEEQLPQIKSWLYDNPDNPELCAKAIDLYKMEKGLSKKRNKRESNDDAAKQVTRHRNPEIQDGLPTKKIWKESEILKLSRSKPNWFEENEAEIDKASREGRIEYDLTPQRR